MAIKKGIRFYTDVLVETFDNNVKAILLYIIRSLERGRPIDLKVINKLLAQLIESASKAASKLATIEAAKFLTLTEKNLQPLKAFIQERNIILRRAAQGYQKVLEPLVGEFSKVSFGRRGRDLIREIGLKNVERGIIKGSIGASRDDLLKDLLEQVPVIDGKFRLEIAPYQGQYRNFDVRYYADLVARTTRREVQNVANTIKAEELGTRLVKFNFTGKNYKKLKDPCEIIDGKTYSIETGGTLINGKYFPYWRDAIRAGFATPHPNCQHFLRPVSEELVSSLEPGTTYAEWASTSGLRGVA